MRNLTVLASEQILASLFYERDHVLDSLDPSFHPEEKQFLPSNKQKTSKLTVRNKFRRYEHLTTDNISNRMCPLLDIESAVHYECPYCNVL